MKIAGPFQPQAAGQKLYHCQSVAVPSSDNPQQNWYLAGRRMYRIYAREWLLQAPLGTPEERLADATTLYNMSDADLDAYIASPSQGFFASYMGQVIEYENLSGTFGKYLSDDCRIDWVSVACSARYFGRYDGILSVVIAVLKGYKPLVINDVFTMPMECALSDADIAFYAQGPQPYVGVPTVEDRLPPTPPGPPTPSTPPGEKQPPELPPLPPVVAKDNASDTSYAPWIVGGLAVAGLGAWLLMRGKKG